MKYPNPGYCLLGSRPGEGIEDMKTREFEVVLEIKSNSQAEAKAQIKKHFNVISVKCLEKRRTTQQSRALHLWFTMLATALNDKHFDMRAIIHSSIDIMWTPQNVKENIFRPVMKALYTKRSTTQLSRQELDPIVDIINKTIAEQTEGEVVYVPFPSLDNIFNE